MISAAETDFCRSSVATTLNSDLSDLMSWSRRAVPRFQSSIRSIFGRAVVWARMRWGAIAPAPTISMFFESDRASRELPRAESAAVFRQVSSFPSMELSGVPLVPSKRT